MGVLDGRVALVTGGSRGIGAAIVRRLAADGAHVAINYRADAEAAEALVSDIGGGQTVALAGDVADPSAGGELVGRTVDRFGRLDILVSNAGVEHFGALDSLTYADYERVFGINVAGQLFMAQAAARVMGEGGRIVLSSSVSARMSVFEHSLYSSSKAAIKVLVANLAPELARRKITINAIAAGGTRSDMSASVADRYTHPVFRDLPAETRLQAMDALGRLAEPEEVAAGVAFLVSPEATFVTGSTLAVDGGT